MGSAAKKYMLPLGIIKVFEFLFLLVAWTTSISAQTDGGTEYVKKYFDGSEVRPAFHIAMCILSWVFVVFWFILGVGGILGKCHGIVSSIFHFVLGVMLLVASSLVTDVISGTENDKYLTSCAFGLISAIVMLIDAFVHVFMGLADPKPDEAS